MTASTWSLSEFLLARIAEDEAVAREATQRGGWTVGFSLRHVATKQDDVLGEMRVGEDAAHIVRHDPARVLAQCAAHRAIVKAHPLITDPQRLVAVWSGSTPGVACETCGGSPVDSSAPVEDIGPCETLLALAQVYRGAPGWREEWAT